MLIRSYSFNKTVLVPLSKRIKNTLRNARRHENTSDFVVLILSIKQNMNPYSAEDFPSPSIFFSCFSAFLSKFLIPTRPIYVFRAIFSGKILSPASVASLLCRSSKEANSLHPISNAAATCQISADREMVATAYFAERISARR